jgi:hypothetical protein
MANKTAGHGSRAAGADPTPAHRQVAAELAERMARVTEENHAIARLLAELALAVTTPEAPRAPEGPEPMWTPQQIADAAGVAYRTVLGWIDAGDLKHVPVGPHKKVPNSEWQRFIRARLGPALRVA